MTPAPDRELAAVELTRLRDAIDRVDAVIVKLLNQRAQYAIDIGVMKGVLALPVYVPEREKAVLHHAESVSRGPLEPAAVRRLFERIIDESRRVEREAMHGNEVLSAEVLSAESSRATVPGTQNSAPSTQHPRSQE